MKSQIFLMIRFRILPTLEIFIPKKAAMDAVGAELAATYPNMGLTPADLLQHQCMRIRLPNGAIYPWHFERAGEVIRLDVNGQLTLDEPSVAKAVVQAGVGLGFFMQQDVQAELDAGQFERVLDDWTPPRDNLCLYYPNRRNPSAALKAFTALARGHLPSKGQRG